MCLVSVVMSVYNAELYLNEAIDSILNQTFADFEFIIINDGSTDKSLEIIKSYKDDRIRFINQRNTGLPKALNNGISIAKSDYIARMDADDISFPDRLEKQFDFLLKNPDYIIIGSNAEIIDTDGNYIFTSNQALTDKKMKEILPYTPFIHPSVMFKKSAFYKAGLYPEYMLNAQDLVLFNRMAKYGKFVNLPDTLIKYRIVPTSNSIRDNINIGQFLSILQKAIQYNQISDEDCILLRSMTHNRNPKKRLSNYYFYIAKKYLWNNYQPKLARENLRKSIKIKTDFFKILLYLTSFLPGILIKKTYKIIK